MTSLPHALTDEHSSFVLIAREGSDVVEILTGQVLDVNFLTDIPLTGQHGPQEVFALVPFRQVHERGFTAHDDAAPLRCLIVKTRESLPRDDALTLLPDERIALHEAGFDIADDEYAKIVQDVISNEIGHGEGANFVIRRDFTARIEVGDRTAALTWFRALLDQERGSYWTFAVVTPGVVAVGASPEAHVSSRGGVVTMNPISGTFRHPPGGVTKHALMEFLSSTKETEELFMVVDEELKMMSQVCSDGGRITGPRLKQMSRLTHTEYMLCGASRMDPRSILRDTMFAPTVTGSPMQNACNVIARYESTPRGYYSGVAALFTPNDTDGHDLDAPILIRTVYLDSGRVRVPVGATLVRHSQPYGEVSETHGKAAGVLGAIGAVPRDREGPDDAPAWNDDPDIRALLEARNSRLADFWLNPQDESAVGPLSGRAVVVDAEDRFTTMLGHQLRHLGLDVDIRSWDSVTDAEVDDADLLVAGPGPGDPRDPDSSRIRRMREIVTRRRAARTPLLAVCLSHQILAGTFDIELAPLDSPHQGVQKTVPIFEQDSTIGFYNTYTARVSAGTRAIGEAQISADPESGDVYALRGPRFASVQGHLESILSRDGISTLERLVKHAMA